MEKEKNVLTLPVAIVVAGVIIGGAVFLSRGGPTKEIFQQPQPAQKTANSIMTDISLRAVDINDHILGNPTAPITMVEYSDLECPFCKQFNATMQALINQYGKSGNLTWVYRHFPLDIHPRSPKESQASECAFEQGGNDKFWAYVEKIFEITPSNNGLDPAQLPIVAGEIGLNVAKFQTCLDSEKYAAKVQADYNDGVKAGVNGTPDTVLILTSPVTADAETKLSQINQTILRQLPAGSQNIISLDSSRLKIGISGALQLPMMKQIIDLLLSGK